MTGGRQHRVAKRIRAGQVYVNAFGAGGGVELPFGGFGRSGHGREKGFEALYGHVCGQDHGLQITADPVPA